MVTNLRIKLKLSSTDENKECIHSATPISVP